MPNDYNADFVDTVSDVILKIRVIVKLFRKSPLKNDCLQRIVKRNLEKDFLYSWIPKLDGMSALLKVKHVHVSAADETELLRSNIISKDRKIGQLEEALREMSLSESKIEMLCSDKIS